MKLYAPEYYRNFRCIADKCRHSCCVGWEIDVDDETYERYCSAETEFSEKIIKSIEPDSEGRHFALTNDERCPFLRDDNLCDIIINMGEDSLCRICSDHPRFRNFYSGCTEIGVGLCCEAAANLILNDGNSADIICISGDEPEECSEENEYFFALRKKYTDVICDSSLPLVERLKKILDMADVVIPDITVAQWAEFYLQLEQLDTQWTKKLKTLSLAEGKELILNPEFEIQSGRLALYFIYRHLADGRFDAGFAERIAFSVLGVYMINTVFEYCSDIHSPEEFADIARIYSSEIEYSEENIETVLELF